MTAGTAWAGERSSNPRASGRPRWASARRSCGGERRRGDDRCAERHHLRDFWADARDTGRVGLWVAALVLVLPGSSRSPASSRGLLAALGDDLGDAGFRSGLLIELAPGVPHRGLVRSWSFPLFLPSWLVLVVAGNRTDLVSPPAGAIQGGRAGPNLHQRDADLARAGSGACASSLSHDHQPVPGGDAQGSPLLPDELKFAQEHGIRYLGSPSDPSEAASSAFLDQTLALAQDPSAWPILVHCHGCMDRSPAWMGIYKFVVKERPLLEVMQEIERHRGYRPKASVILLYNGYYPPAPADGTGRIPPRPCCVNVPRGLSTQ